MTAVTKELYELASKIPVKQADLIVSLAHLLNGKNEAVTQHIKNLASSGSFTVEQIAKSIAPLLMKTVSVEPTKKAKKRSSTLKTRRALELICCEVFDEYGFTDLTNVNSTDKKSVEALAEVKRRADKAQLKLKSGDLFPMDILVGKCFNTLKHQRGGKTVQEVLSYLRSGGWPKKEPVAVSKQPTMAFVDERPVSEVTVRDVMETMGLGGNTQLEISIGKRAAKAWEACGNDPAAKTPIEVDGFDRDVAAYPAHFMPTIQQIIRKHANGHLV